VAVVDPDKISEIIREAAEIHIKPRYQALEDHEISSKTGPHDLVTQADIETEEYLTKILPDLLPSSIVIGEEGVSRGDANIAVLQEDDRKIWVVDPVDGTHNFVHHKPDFGVMLACVINGVTELAWIYDVLKDEMYVAEKGSGSYRNGESIYADQSVEIGEMTAHINYRYFPKEVRPHIKERMEVFKEAYSIGSAAHEYTRIARGASHLSLYSRLKPWDHLPGALLVEEAGGYIAKWDQNPYTPKDDYAGLIVTNSKENWEQACHHFFDGLDLSKYL